MRTNVHDKYVLTKSVTLIEQYWISFRTLEKHSNVLAMYVFSDIWLIFVLSMISIFNGPPRSQKAVSSCLVMLLTTDQRCSPLYAGSGFIACLSICCYSSTETFAVPSAVTCTWVKHTGVVVRTWIHLRTDDICQQCLYFSIQGAG